MQDKTQPCTPKVKTMLGVQTIIASPEIIDAGPHITSIFLKKICLYPWDVASRGPNATGCQCQWIEVNTNEPG